MNRFTDLMQQAARNIERDGTLDQYLNPDAFIECVQALQAVMASRIETPELRAQIVQALINAGAL